jgi:hypoxanthine phosphoribosyltransferase
MPDLIPVLTKDEIKKSVADLAKQISEDYQNCEVVIIGVLKGAFIFLADLIRHISIPVKVDFVRLASYGSSTETSGSICLTKELEIDISGLDVLVVEDIIDTGLSLEFLLEYLRSMHPNSLRLCTLIDKRERRNSQIAIDYVGCIVDRGFLVGYGLDYAEQYRHLPAIYDLKV